jgi:peptidoglycan/xylan/chitin deacetylase (PgdA/CDA1 family)
VNYAFLKHASNIIHTTHADQLIGRAYKGVGAIIMGHSVVKDRNDLVDPTHQISGDFLDLIIRYYIAHSIDIISINEAMDRLASGNTKHFVCFTFDDGYRDNFTVAFPIFKKYNKPFAIYVTTAFLERRKNNWWGPLREIIRQHDQPTLNVGGKNLRVSTPKEKMKAFQDLRHYVEKQELGIDEIVRASRQRSITAGQVLDADALDCIELQRLSSDPLVEIGGHTDSHPILAQLTVDQVRTEILSNVIRLQALTGKPVQHFAYPYGDAKSCGEREFAICREFGFRTATTTRFGGLFPDHLKHHTSLPRIRFNGACESIAFMECQRNGAVTAIKTRFQNPVVSA